LGQKFSGIESKGAGKYLPFVLLLIGGISLPATGKSWKPLSPKKKLVESLQAAKAPF